jgi:RNA polymerase sigma-70 factor, ECF subfamily
VGGGKGDDRAGFDSWVTAHWRELVAISRLVAADPHAAEDVLQDALIDLYSRWDRIAQFDNLLGYATRVIGSKLANRRRTAWARRVWVTGEHGDLDSSSLDGIMASDDYLDVVGALQALNARQREIIAMHYLLDMPVARIAAQLDRPVGSITSDLTRARKTLRTLLAEGGEGA